MRIEQVSFFEPCVPPTTTHHSKKITTRGKFARLVDSAALVEAKDTITAILLKHRPEKPISGPVRLELKFGWPYRSSEPKKNRGADIPKTTKPDCSNLAKTVEDLLVRLRFMEDDANVVELWVAKAWTDTPGIGVTIISIDREDSRGFAKG